MRVTKAAISSPYISITTNTHTQQDKEERGTGESGTEERREVVCFCPTTFRMLRPVKTCFYGKGYN